MSPKRLVPTVTRPVVKLSPRTCFLELSSKAHWLPINIWECYHAVCRKNNSVPFLLRYRHGESNWIAVAKACKFPALPSNLLQRNKCLSPALDSLLSTAFSFFSFFFFEGMGKGMCVCGGILNQTYSSFMTELQSQWTLGDCTSYCIPRTDQSENFSDMKILKLYSI